MKPYEKLLKESLTIEEWHQWLEEVSEYKQECELSSYIRYHDINMVKDDKIKFSKKLKMAEHKNFLKGWIYYKDYLLYYVYEYKEVYDEKDLSTHKQLKKFGFNERQREFIMNWEETPFYYNTDNFDEFYGELMNGIIPVSLLINLYFEYIKVN